MAKFFLLSLLVVAVSMVESFSVVPYPSAAGVPSFGYGYAYNTAPIVAPGSRSGLGPFFGYFPDMFGTPCPAGPPAVEAFTTCNIHVFLSGISVSPNGTIKLSDDTLAGNTCSYAIKTAPGTKIKINCKATTSDGTLYLSPRPTGVPEGDLSFGTDYTIDGNQLVVFLSYEDADHGKADCTWSTA